MIQKSEKIGAVKVPNMGDMKWTVRIRTLSMLSQCWASLGWAFSPMGRLGPLVLTQCK